MNIDRIFSDSSFNARLLLKEIQKRGISLEKFGHKYFIKAIYKEHIEILYDTYTSLTSSTSSILINDKYYSKKFLKSNSFSAILGEVFTRDAISEALRYAENIGYPVVLKPTVGSHGDFVFMDIRNAQELEGKIKWFLRVNPENIFYLIEKQCEGKEFRLFIAKNNFFAAVMRTPANVIGDGKNSLNTLIKNENYRRMNPRGSCLCEIKIDDIVYDYLRKNNLTLSYVPKVGKVVFLRKNSNVSTGGNCYDITDKVHPSYKKLAKSILNKFSDVAYLGIDLICKDIAKENNCAVCELNSFPGLSLHMMPEKGSSRNVAAAIIDILFPETKHA